MRPIQGFLMVLVMMVTSDGTEALLHDEDAGYYPFEEVSGLTPPTVRKPPYAQTNALCPGLFPRSAGRSSPEDVLCGDLDAGHLPQNPMGQAPLGQVYPFDLIENKTLDYLGETLPFLREDGAIPRVAKFQGQIVGGGGFPRKRKRATEATPGGASPTRAIPTGRSEHRVDGRGFCDGGDGIFCRFFGTFFPQRSGRPTIHHRNDEVEADVDDPSQPTAVATPCPSEIEYATPAFAKNHQGLWRYVVQIPHEGYLTQTVEVARCPRSRCRFLEGRCRPSLRWTSLLVAEIYYPNAFFPTTVAPPPHPDTAVPPVANFHAYQQYLVRRAGRAAREPTEAPDYCDGYDATGCFQVRLFYDWFLVPGACQCWTPVASNPLLGH